MTRREFIGGCTAVAASAALGKPRRSSIGGRRDYGSRNGLPYDSEIEYLESTVTQYIDAGIGYFADFECTIRLRSSVPNKAIGIGRSDCLQRASATNPVWSFSVNNTTWTSAIPITEWHTVSWKDGVVSCDGYVVNPNCPKPYMRGTMQLFGVSGATYPNMIARCILFDIDGTVVRDFIPVKFTNKIGETEGALFDRATGKMHYNAGSGKFIVGPDKGI